MNPMPATCAASTQKRYDVEHEAQRATSLSAYLPVEYVDDLVAPWKGSCFSQRTGVPPSSNRPGGTSRPVTPSRTT